MSDLMREEFEAWAATNAFLGLSESCMERHNEGYLGCELHAAWEAWQASRECMVIELPIIQECCSDGGESSKWMAPEDVIKSIHAAGVKYK